jgi:hypothetical protein
MTPPGVYNNDPWQDVERTRSLCPYPQISAYKGAGDPNDAANFMCVDDEDDYEGTVNLSVRLSRMQTIGVWHWGL